ncbi:MAG: hypothetical protein ACRBCI_13975 [Cellvibrionaceae bacterium]
MTLSSTLLIIHITAGAIALLSGLGASIVKQMSWKHHWHQRFGRCFFYGMSGIFLTAVPLSLITENIFLLLISLFTFYFAYTGWRYAINRTGKPKPQDWIAVVIMLVICIAMLFYGLMIYLLEQDGNGITLAAFGIIGGANALRNGHNFQAGHFQGKNRIALHATMMLAGTIATITAFVVTNFTSNPVYILWLAPTVLITPYIVYWNIKIRKKQSSKEAL